MSSVRESDSEPTSCSCSPTHMGHAAALAKGCGNHPVCTCVCLHNKIVLHVLVISGGAMLHV
jgi:hypothetical protein